MTHARHHARRLALAFDRLSDWTIRASGTAPAFAGALAVVLAWLAFAPLVGFANTDYQLAINTTTTIVTFLMVFLVQNAQNRAAEHDEKTRARLERMEREHGEQLAALHAILADLHAHTRCDGHTTIETTPPTPAPPTPPTPRKRTEKAKAGA